jgi:hypothetical protein
MDNIQNNSHSYFHTQTQETVRLGRICDVCEYLCSHYASVLVNGAADKMTSRCDVAQTHLYSHKLTPFDGNCYTFLLLSLTELRNVWTQFLFKRRISEVMSCDLECCALSPIRFTGSCLWLWTSTNLLPYIVTGTPCGDKCSWSVKLTTPVPVTVLRILQIACLRPTASVVYWSEFLATDP